VIHAAVRASACAVTLLVAAGSAAQVAPLPERGVKEVVAVRINEPISIDGQLDEAAWRQAQPATGFVQQEPDEGQPETRRTEVRFLYDQSTLYVGARMYDEAPQRAVTNELIRDFGGLNGDMLGVVLDTFLDRRNAYGFLTNPGGAQRETQAYDAGQRNDANWNGVWFVRTAQHADAWSAEIAIPFKTLRFPERSDQRWGLNLVRVVRRENHIATWSYVPRPFSHYHVGYAGLLTGISGVSPGRNLRVTPFTTAQTEQRIDAWRSEADGGVDLKWAVTPSLVLDGTYRTDFAQVEADTQQINLTRFSLFFPEKRQFFLESPGSFQIGLESTAPAPVGQAFIPFFTRRIGLSSTGQPIPVHGGARLTGRLGGATIGLLNMQTDRFGPRPGDNFTAVRLARGVGRGFTLGGFYFGREAAGSGAGADVLGQFNRVAGADVRFSPHRTVDAEGLLGRSSTDGPEDDWVGRSRFRLLGNTHRATFDYTHVGELFRHDLGFVRRRDIAQFYGDYSYVMRPGATRNWAREHTVTASVLNLLDSGYDQTLTRQSRLAYAIGLSGGGEIRAQGELNFERELESFELGPGVPVPAGRYYFNDLMLSFQSDQSQRLSGSLRTNIGDFWTGTRRHVGFSARWRLNAHLATVVEYDREQIALASGSFVDDVGLLRVNWSLTTRMFLNALVQYNGAIDTWLSNVRFNLIHRPLSDIYVVWNEARGPGPTSRAFVVKYTYSVGF
jgi:hypothetical protein